MSEMRHDPIQRRWVVIATERGKRPHEYETPGAPRTGGEDPFLYGNEHMTPPEVYALRDKSSKPDTPGWHVRVVPNKFPALKVEGDLNREGIGLFDRMDGVGAHEVVVETPEPEMDFPDYSLDHAVDVLRTYRMRLHDLMQDRRFKYVMIFRNHGEAAGASQPHAHTQIVALPVTPLTLAIELRSAMKHFADKERCLFCDILQQEQRENRRIIQENDLFVAFAPYASRFPFEVTIMPKKHAHDFREVGDGELPSLAAMLQDVILRIKLGLHDPAYNIMIHTSPNTNTWTPRPSHWGTIRFDWHWHIEIFPRLTSVAGFEWGTGFFINPTPPEQAADVLRSIELE